jgi:dTDP-4-dehydrorhamnose 3,5-epimerase
MDIKMIDGVRLTSLKIIYHPKGDIYHGLKVSDEGFDGFGEAYFSGLKPNEIKGWNRHKLMTLNLVVPVGSVIFVIYDDRTKSKTNGKYFSVNLSKDNYQRLTIPPGLLLAYKGGPAAMNMILNIANIEHDPNELEKYDITHTPFSWGDL